MESHLWKSSSKDRMSACQEYHKVNLHMEQGVGPGDL